MPFVIIEDCNVGHKLLIVHLMAGKIPVLLGVDTLHGDVQPVQARVDDLQAPLRGQQ